MNYNKLKNVRDYLLVTGVIANSTMPLFMTKKMVIIIFIINSLFFILKKNKSITKETFFFFFILLFVVFIQFASFGLFYLPTMILQLMFFLSAFFCVAVVRDRFFKLFSNIVFFTIIPSIIIFLLHFFYLEQIESFASSLPNFLKNTVTIYDNDITTSGIIIYHFNPNGFVNPRNNGPCWEPGVYAAMLIIAFLSNYLYEKKLFSKRNIFFISAILTTFSTTGYITLFFIIILIMLDIRKISMMKVATVILILGMSLCLYNTLPFLKAKINDEKESTNEVMAEQGGNSRSASAILDIQELLSSKFSAFFGNGSHTIPRLGNLKESLRNNGFTDLFARWGIPLSLLYLYYMFGSFKMITKSEGLSIYYTWIFFISILILSQSEPYYRNSLFHCFIFFKPYFKNIDV